MKNNKFTLCEKKIRIVKSKYIYIIEWIVFVFVKYEKNTNVLRHK